MNKFNCGLWTKVQPQDMAETKEFPRVKPLAQWSPYIDYSEEQERQEQEQTKAFFLGTLSELASLTILCTTIYILIKMM
jgi:hypothetical protein